MKGACRFICNVSQSMFTFNCFGKLFLITFRSSTLYFQSANQKGKSNFTYQLTSSIQKFSIFSKLFKFSQDIVAQYASDEKICEVSFTSFGKIFFISFKKGFVKIFQTNRAINNLFLNQIFSNFFCFLLSLLFSNFDNFSFIFGRLNFKNNHR
jgi:hypothetical protein